MKIGILTFHNAMNYGAILQCYALQSYIEKEYGSEVFIVNYTPKYFNKVFFDPMKPLKAFGVKNKIKACIKYFIRHEEMHNMSRKNRELTGFINQYLHLGNTVSKPQEDNCDIFIAGSDQIWNLELLENDTTYLLDFVKSSKRVAYAASFKVSDVSDFAITAYRKYLPLFDAISVRETNLKNYLEDNMGVESVSVIDPTLLVNSAEWETIKDSRTLIRDRYVLLYYVNLPLDLVNQAFDYAKNHNLKVVSLNKLRGYSEYIDYSMASIPEFLNLIANAEVVFTTSFHGMAFSINFETEFYFEVPENSYNNNERLLDLARKLEVEDRNIVINGFDKGIDWKKVKKNLETEKHIASDFLNNILKENR